MAFNENTAQRIREILQQKDVGFFEKKMFGGICFMVDNKMCCGTRIDKKSGGDLLLCRIGEAAYEKAIEQESVIPMEFTGRKMKDFIYVTENGFNSPKDLSYWLGLCIGFNPFAKAGKK
jgi:hypothetical protein